MEKNKIILFDLDGTLIDSTEAILESFSVAFTVCGGNLPDERRITEKIGYPLDVMFTSLGVESIYIDEYVKAYRAQYQKISCEKTKLLPKAEEAIVLAHQEAHLGVVTTKTGKYSIILLEHMGLMHYFDVMVGREDVQFPKPHPEPIEKALQQLPKVTGGVWMIGDTCMDMESASNANINKMAVLSGYASHNTLSECTTNIVKNSYEAVRQILASTPERR